MLTIMLTIVRLALQVVLFFVLLGLVVAVAAAETGIAEKAVLVAAGAALIWLAPKVRQIGRRSSPRPV
jgi:hypothetical protein